MIQKLLLLIILTLLVPGCKNRSETTSEKENQPIQIVGAMKNVMWQGKLEGSILLDTLTEKEHLYGLGPESFLKGELLINDGQAFVSRVVSDSSMMVEKTWEVSAPFFVYGTVPQWNQLPLPKEIKTLKDLERFISENAPHPEKPFAFKLEGRVNSAVIHIQNLPEGTKVSSPKEAHQGQTNYTLTNEAVTIVGFYSTRHQGIFTHHDSFLHMHLITKEETKMGHLDEAILQDMILYLPK
ncbi:MAG: alpha-acetolactate decarboxylase [Flavobacteriaceae bacterium]|mgnify:CR=1 FL=1|nr:alpha-acetolactate decarboxylase [Flavobacteriaceae bacterium]|tara:strand:- start:2178 stop:2897 length:720 start_codon:yes stop_codon:yes gene_type:complete